MISRQAPHLIHIPSGVLTRFSPSSFLRNSRIAIASSPHRLFQGLHEPSEGHGPLTRCPVTLPHPRRGWGGERFPCPRAPGNRNQVQETGSHGRCPPAPVPAARRGNERDP